MSARKVKFVKEFAVLQIKQIFPEKGDILRNKIVEFLSHECTEPIKCDDKLYWEMEILDKKIRIDVVLATPHTELSDIGILSVTEIEK